MAAQTHTDFAGLTRPQGQLDPATALQPYRGQLDERLAAHLLRRAGFGGTPDDVSRYAALSVNDAVESLVRFPSTGSITPPEEIYDIGGPQPMSAMGGQPPMKRAKIVRREARQALLALQLWWLNRMLSSQVPLQEKMTLYFHGHFTSHYTLRFPQITYNQNALFRRYALGNLRELTRQVSKDPAMLIYLNGAQNVAAHPNENYARELMELFTLGVDHYTENDVRESARAWTGWRVDRRSAQATFDPQLHDNGVKTFLGQTGSFTGDDVVNIIFEQPACARFFAASLLSWFVYNNPESELVDGVAALLRKHDFELAPVVSTILRSNVFYSTRAYRALVKSPVEFTVGTYKVLGVAQVDEIALPALHEMGQELFNPPNVAGWPGGQNWLTSGTMIARQNFLTQLLNSQTLTQSSWLEKLPVQTRVASQTLVATILQGDAAPAALYELDGYLSGAGSAALAALTTENYGLRISGAAYLAMAMPAYQLN
jgi:uncharacterized protein (DUF1800 family)